MYTADAVQTNLLLSDSRRVLQLTQHTTHHFGDSLSSIHTINCSGTDWHPKTNKKTCTKSIMPVPCQPITYASTDRCTEHRRHKPLAYVPPLPISGLRHKNKIKHAHRARKNNNFATARTNNKVPVKLSLQQPASRNCSNPILTSLESGW